MTLVMNYQREEVTIYLFLLKYETLLLKGLEIFYLIGTDDNLE